MLANEDVPAILEHQTQDMLDAVSAGSSAIWDRNLDAKAALIAPQTPCGKGLICSTNYTFVDTVSSSKTLLWLHISRTNTRSSMVTNCTASTAPPIPGGRRARDGG
jgi:hypothetical protein